VVPRKRSSGEEKVMAAKRKRKPKKKKLSARQITAIVLLALFAMGAVAVFKFANLKKIGSPLTKVICEDTCAERTAANSEAVQNACVVGCGLGIESLPWIGDLNLSSASPDLPAACLIPCINKYGPTGTVQEACIEGCIGVHDFQISELYTIGTEE